MIDKYSKAFVWGGDLIGKQFQTIFGQNTIFLLGCNYDIKGTFQQGILNYGQTRIVKSMV